MALRVLLADDEKEFVETLAERLDLRGIEVRVALDGKTALTTLDEMAAAEALPDVMVVDLLMPGMTGDAVLQQVRQKYPGLPVIVLTGHDSVDDSGDSPVASAFACLTKPLSLGMFLETKPRPVPAAKAPIRPGGRSMTDSQCMGRLLASATHDMRNVLAVIRESAGLAQDMVQLAAGADKSADPRVIKALKEAQQQILRGAALAECMEYLAQVSHSENENAPCDLARVASTFCLMAARRARAVQMVLECADSEEPVWSAVPALAVLRALLDIFDLCASVGGQVKLRFSAGRQNKVEGIIIEVCDGANRDMALAALTGSPLLNARPRPGWQALLMPWRDPAQRFFLSISACGSED